MKRLLTLLAVITSLYASIQAQNSVLTIELFTGDIPSYITWEVLDSRYSTIASQDSTYTHTDSLHTIDIQIDPAKCYIVDIRVAHSTDPQIINDTTANFKVHLDGALLDEGHPDLEEALLINCERGRTCTNAIEIGLIPFEANIQMDGNNDVWYFYRPRVSQLFQILTCTIDPNLPDKTPDTDVWIYDNCNVVPESGPEGAILSKEGEDCVDISAVSLRMTTKYLFRIRSNEENPHAIKFFLDLSDSIQGCMDINSCNYDPYARLDDGSCFYDNCQPDLALAPIKETVFLDSLIGDVCSFNEGCIKGLGRRDIIRFGTDFENIGNADYIIGEASRDNPEIIYDNCHGHFHKVGYAEYLLYDEDSNILPVGFKAGYCLADQQCDDRRNAKFSCDFMGVSVGCKDIYSASTLCQWIDVTDVPDGKYTLVNRINWNRAPDIRGFEESNYDNNWSQVCIELDRSEGQLALIIYDECPVYRDCFGVAYGPGERDCAGVCGGPSHYGDIDGDLVVDHADVDLLMKDIMDGDMLDSPCFDLNGDNVKSLLDAAILQQCISSEADTLEGHSHCEFPTTVEQLQDTVMFTIQDLEQGHFDLLYNSQQHTLRGARISFSNITIDSIEILSPALIINNIEYNNDEVLFLSDPNTALYTTEDFTPLMRVYVSEILDGTACIGDVTEVINQDYQQIVGVILEQCIISSTDESPLVSSVTIYPNPIANSKLEIIGGIENFTNWQIYNSQGSLLSFGQLGESDPYSIDISTLGTGCYFITFKHDNNLIVRKFVKI